MELTAADNDVFTAYLADFTDLAGDARTGRLLDQTVRGIIGAERLCCARSAAFSPRAGRQPAKIITDDILVGADCPEIGLFGCSRPVVLIQEVAKVQETGNAFDD